MMLCRLPLFVLCMVFSPSATSVAYIPTACMRGGTSTDESPGEPRRSKRQRIDLTSEEGFDRHELERALRQSLEEERLREKEKPTKRATKTKAEKVKPVAHPTVKKRKVKESEPEDRNKGEGNKSEAKQTKTSPPARRVSDQKKSPASKKEKIVAVKKTKGEEKEKETKADTTPVSTTSKKQVGRETEETTESPKKNENKSSKGSKIEESPAKTTTPKKQQPVEKLGVTDKKINEEKEATSLTETATSTNDKVTEESQKDKPETAEAPRLPPPYRIPSRASDLITLLACAKEVLGDHEYTSDND